MASAKQKLKDYFIQHVGKDIDRETLREITVHVRDVGLTFITHLM